MARRAWAVWQERMRRYERSGLTVARFCDKEGVSAPSFYQWRKRFGSAPAVAPRQQAAPVFQQLTLAPRGGVVYVELASGARMELPAENLAVVRAVVAELLQAEHDRAGGDA